MKNYAEEFPVKGYPAPTNGTQLPSNLVLEPTVEFDDSADLRTYLEILLRRKWLVLTIVAFALVTTLIVSLTMKPIYKAGGRLELSPRAPKVTKFEDMVATAQTLQTQELIQTHVKMLQSDSLAERVIKAIRLDQRIEDSDPGLLASLRATVKGWLDTLMDWLGPAEKEAPSPELAELRKQQGLLGWLLTNLEVSAERGTTLVSVSFKSTDPALTRDVINTLFQELISWQMDKRIDAAGSAKLQLEKQLDVARIQLEKAETGLNAFAQKAGIVSLNSNLNLIYSQLEEVNRALSAAQNERIGKESLFKQAQHGSSGAFPAILESQLLQKLKEEYGTVSREYREISSTYRDDYPRLKALKAKLSDAERQINTEESRIRESIKNDYLTALQKEESLRKEADEKKALALKLNDAATQYKILEREVETNKQIHQSLLERSKEIDANVGTELGNIQVVDYAKLPLDPFKPKVPLNLLLALVVGLMGGAGLAFFLEYLDNTVKQIDEFSDRFQMPILGVLPLVRDEALHELDHLVHLKPRANFSEAVRTAKVSIQLSSSMDQPPKSLLITSTSQGEGKSTVAVNLAQAFASSEEKVILIDADLRKPRLHKVFGSNGNGNGSGAHKGLSQYLSGMCGIEDVVHSTDMSSLSFIPAGPIPPNPAELLASSRMRRMLDYLSGFYDRIIIDAPPAVGFADVLVLGHYASGVILVGTLGETHRDALRIFRKNIYGVGGRLIGCMVNKLNLSTHYGGYYYKYYRYYTYNYQASPDQAQSMPILPEGASLIEDESFGPGPGTRM